MVNFVTRNHQPHLCFADGVDGKHSAILTGDGCRPFNGCALHDKRNGAGSGHQFPFFDERVIVKGGAHDLIDHVKGSQSTGVNRKQPVFSCQQLDFSFPGLVLPGNAVTGQRIG